ncbi:MAG: hypothetical protein ACE5D8_05025 [Fidelibacterota bacterium]
MLKLKKHQKFMLAGALLLLPLYFLPLWKITLQAPQYPIPLGIKIYVNHLAGVHEGDIKNIDLLNHYIGMDSLPKEMIEFVIFPIVIGVLAVLAILVALSGKRNLYLFWFVLIGLFGIAGFYDFYYWLYEYGHNLNPKAAIKIPGQMYQPPIFGIKHIMNFRVASYPASGAYSLFAGILLSLVAWFSAKKSG